MPSKKQTDADDVWKIVFLWFKIFCGCFVLTLTIEFAILFSYFLCLVIVCIPRGKKWKIRNSSLLINE